MSNYQTSDLPAHKKQWTAVGHMENLDALKMLQLRGSSSLKLWVCLVLIPDPIPVIIFCVNNSLRLPWGLIWQNILQNVSKDTENIL